MKYFIVFLFALVSVSCKQQPKAETPTMEETAKEEMVVKNYPEALVKVFIAHGGLDTWKKQRTLQYDMPNPENTETHTIDLWSRKDKVASNLFTMGFDGKQPWLLDPTENYKGNVEFYHNLMFYFYAMPFVLADDGIVYSETDDLVFEGANYPGIRISYNTGVGTSPKDEYYIHYDAETYQMAWLGYTVTYRSGEKSDNVKWIRYDDWAAVNGMVLPKSMTWYNYEGHKIQDARSTASFENISVSEQAKPRGFYDKPEDAVYWDKPEGE